MTKEELDAANAVYSRLRSASARINYINRYPSVEVAEDGTSPPQAMVTKHRNDYSKWAERELAKAQKEFDAL